MRRVEAAAWFGSGLVCGVAGLLLSNLVGLDIVGLTFLVIPALAAALIGQLRSLWITLAAGFVIGLVQSCLTAFSSVGRVPHDDAVRAGHHRPALVRPAPPGAGADVAGERRSHARRPTRPRRPATSSAAPRRLAQPGRRLVAAHACSSWSSLFGLPALLDSYWLQIMTSVVIYSIVTLGLGLLIGRVGMVSLCQFVLVAIGAWVALRLDYATSLPFPLLLLLAGVITGVHRHPDRPAGAAAVGPLPGPDHADGGRRAHGRAAASPSSPTAAAGSSATRGPAARRRALPRPSIAEGDIALLPLLRASWPR